MRTTSSIDLSELFRQQPAFQARVSSRVNTLLTLAAGLPRELAGLAHRLLISPNTVLTSKA